MLTMIFLRSALGTYIYMHKDIIVYLNLYELSSLQIQEKSESPQHIRWNSL